MPMDSKERSRFARLAALPSAAAALLVLVAGGQLMTSTARPLRAAEPEKKAAPASTPAPSSATATTEDAATPQASAKKAQLDAYMKLAQPGEHHKRLDSFVGKWKVSGKTWFEPGKPAGTDFAGSMESTWLLGGRFLQSVHKSEFYGMPFEGRALDGYDNATNEYFSTWIDTMGTGVMVFRGKCDDPCKVLTETAEGFDPMAGKVMKTREVTTFIDPDTYRFEMYMVAAAPDGKDVKVMELTGKREK
jgi:hypothetical protein